MKVARWVLRGVFADFLYPTFVMPTAIGGFVCYYIFLKIFF